MRLKLTLKLSGVLVLPLLSLLTVELGVAHSKSQLPKAHRHVGVNKSDAGETIAEFTMAEATPGADDKREDIVKSRNQNYEAFTVSGTRLFVAERKSGKIFEIRGLPLEWRPFSDLVWADDRTLMFDRWSQPHYGVHYSVDVKVRKLLAAVPFPDKQFVEQQRPSKPTKE